jgi:uncharacterized protein YbaR (Trm112 family)
MQAVERVIKILEMVACPACHGPLVLDSTANAVRCRECGKSYPVVDGIPVLLVSRAHSGPGPDINGENTEK